MTTAFATETNCSFSAMFGKERKSRFILDLSKASVLDVLKAYMDHKHKTSPGYSNLSIINNLKTIQENYLQVLMPEDITDEFYSCFIAWGYERELKSSTIKAYCDAIKTALRWGSKYGCRVSPSFEEYSIKCSEPAKVSLSADEVSYIAHFSLDNLKMRQDHRRTLERVRDTFVLQTNLFCRYSDRKKICRGNFDGTIYTCVQQKTGGKAVVDINRYSITPKLAMSLLEKYDYTCPYSGDINNYNKLLHELLSHLGGTFDDEVIHEEKINGTIVRNVYKKRDLIASHTSRRTAITLAVKNAKTESEIRRCSGHAGGGRDSFHRYIVYE